MFKNLATITTLSLLLTTFIPAVAKAETVMEKVARTGVLAAGTSKDAIPFAYTNNQGQLVGYSVDMLNLIKEQLEKELGKKFRLQLISTCAKLISYSHRLKCLSSGHSGFLKCVINFA